jgi:hypothetical protein
VFEALKVQAPRQRIELRAAHSLGTSEISEYEQPRAHGRQRGPKAVLLAIMHEQSRKLELAAPDQGA